MISFSGINLSAGFGLNVAEPLDLKTKLSTVDRLNMDDSVQAWVGMVVYDTNDNIRYKLTSYPSSNPANWTVFGGGGLTDIENGVTDFVGYQGSGILFADSNNGGKITNVDYFSYDQNSDILTMGSPNNGAFDMRNPRGSFNWRPSYGVGNPWTSYMDLRENMFRYEANLDMGVGVIHQNLLNIQDQGFESTSMDITNSITTSIYHDGSTMQFARLDSTAENTSIGLGGLGLQITNSTPSGANTTSLFSSAGFETTFNPLTGPTGSFESKGYLSATYTNSALGRTGSMSLQDSSVTILSSNSGTGKNAVINVNHLGNAMLSATDSITLTAGPEQIYGNAAGLITRANDAPWTVAQASNNFVGSQAVSLKTLVATSSYNVLPGDYHIVCDVDTTLNPIAVLLQDPTGDTSGLEDISRKIIIQAKNNVSGLEVEIYAVDPIWFEEPSGTGSYLTTKKNQVITLVKRYDPNYGFDRWFIESDTQPLAYASPGLTGSGPTNAITVWDNTGFGLTGSNDYRMEWASFKVLQTPIGTAINNTNSWYEATRSINGAAQFNIRNNSNGNNASSGFIVTGDNGTDATLYTEFGRNSSTYNQASQNFVGSNSGYILHDGAGDFGIATSATSGSFRVAVGGFTTTQRKLEISAQNVIFTNNGYAHTWSNNTNSTRGSDSMSNTANSRTVNLRTMANTYSGGGALGVSWYMNGITNTFTPGSNVTAGSYNANLIMATMNVNASRTVALSDFMGGNESAIISNSGTLSISGATRGVAVGKVYQVSLSSTVSTVTLPANGIASAFSITPSVSPIIGNVLRSSHIVGELGFNFSNLNKTSGWGLLATKERNWMAGVMIGTDGTYATANVPTVNPSSNPNAGLIVRNNHALGRQNQTLQTASFTLSANSDPVRELDSTSTPITVTLPAGATGQDLTFTLTETASAGVSGVTISAPVGTLIDGLSSITMPAFGSTGSNRSTIVIRSTRDGLNRKTISCL